MNNINHQLHQKELITNEQFDYLEAIRTNKIVSLYFELRLILYLGIMLLTGALGYIAYQNMGNFGHIIAMILITAAIVGCFIFVNKYALPYSNGEITINHTYYDYILILGALLIIALFTYIQIYAGIPEVTKALTLVGAITLLALAYRYDSSAILSLGLVAFAATVGVNISLSSWQSAGMMESSNLFASSIILGICYYTTGYLSDKKQIKAHFRFSYQNFGLILYLIGLIIAIFASDYNIAYALWLLASTIVLAYNSWHNKEFLFFLYATISGYIAFTFLFFQFLNSVDEEAVMIFFIPLSSIGLVAFLIINKKHFTNDK